MKILKRPHRSGSVRMVRNKPVAASAPQTMTSSSNVESTSKPTEAHPLSDVLGTFGGEAWEEYRAMLQKLRQQDAEDDTVE